MSVYNFEKQAHILKVIAHPVRLKIMQLLLQQGATSVSAICQSLEAEQSLISHHLAKLKDRGVLSDKRQGKQILYSMSSLVQIDENGNVTVGVS